MKRKTTQRRRKSNSQYCSKGNLALHNRYGKTRKRLAVTGGAAVLLVLLYLLRGQFGVGIGENEGNGQGEVSVNRTENRLQNVSTPSKKETTTQWYRDGVVNLRTQKDGYEIDTSQKQSQPSYVSIDVEQLKKIVAEAPGNSQGIKVSIYFAPFSTPEIEEQLETILRKMNLVKNLHYRIENE